MRATISLMVGAMVFLFAILLIKREVLIKLYRCIKELPKFVKIILFIVLCGILIFMAYFEIKTFYLNPNVH